MRNRPVSAFAAIFLRFRCSRTVVCCAKSAPSLSPKGLASGSMRLENRTNYLGMTVSKKVSALHLLLKRCAKRANHQHQACWNIPSCKRNAEKPQRGLIAAWRVNGVDVIEQIGSVCRDAGGGCRTIRWSGPKAPFDACVKYCRVHHPRAVKTSFKELSSDVAGREKTTIIDTLPFQTCLLSVVRR